MIGDVCRVALHESMTDLDSHTDQCLLGNNTLVVHDYDKLVNVVGYDPRGPVTRSLHTISGALAYDCPDSGETFILISPPGNPQPQTRAQLAKSISDEAQ